MSVSKNADKTLNYSISGAREVGDGDLTVSGNAFVNNYRPETDKFNPKAPQFSAVGGSVGVAHIDGHTASLSAQHIPSFGNQVTAATQVNVSAKGNHRVDVNAFTTHSMPKGPSPSFQTHGAGVDYQFKEKFNAGASVARTPLSKQTDYSVTTGVNLHKTPTTSLDFNVGANRTDTPFGRGNWEPRAFMAFKKSF